MISIYRIPRAISRFQPELCGLKILGSELFKATVAIYECQERISGRSHCCRDWRRPVASTGNDRKKGESKGKEAGSCRAHQGDDGAESLIGNHNPGNTGMSRIFSGKPVPPRCPYAWGLNGDSTLAGSGFLGGLQGPMTAPSMRAVRSLSADKSCLSDFTSRLNSVTSPARAFCPDSRCVKRSLSACWPVSRRATRSPRADKSRASACWPASRRAIRASSRVPRLAPLLQDDRRQNHASGDDGYCFRGRSHGKVFFECPSAPSWLAGHRHVNPTTLEDSKKEHGTE